MPDIQSPEDGEPMVLRVMRWSAVVLGFLFLGLTGSLVSEFRLGYFPLLIVFCGVTMFGWRSFAVRASSRGRVGLSRRQMGVAVLLPQIVALISGGLGWALALFVLPPHLLNARRVLLFGLVALAYWSVQELATRRRASFLIINLSVWLLVLLDFALGPILPTAIDPFRVGTLEAFLVGLCLAILWIGATALEFRLQLRAPRPSFQPLP